MNLDHDHLERVARFAGYCTAVDEDDAPLADASVDLKPSAAIRFKTPDAPAPRTTALALIGPSPSTARWLMTTYVTQAYRGAQNLIGSRGAHA
jgi:hypothetical protein